MSKTEITVEEVKTILGCTYATALKIAQEHGEMRDVGRGTDKHQGKWYVPVSVIEARVQSIVTNAHNIQDRLDWTLSYGANS